MDFHRDGTLPSDPNTIFVFGSNLAGRHGRGAARIAMNNFGAVYGKGVGAHGNSYAIPTKSKRIQPLELDEIQEGVLDFVRYACQNPDKKFFVTRVGCVLAGYGDFQIAPMFRGSPSNCSFAEEWRKYLTAADTAADVFG